MAGGASLRVFRAPWSTNCERVALALAHKGIEATSVLIDYSNRTPVEAVSGQGLVPVIEQSDGVVVSDSVAIMRHLDRLQPEPQLFATEPARRAELDVFIEWFERAYKHEPNAIEAELELERPDHEAIARDSAVMQSRLGVFEQLLEGRDHLFGEFGAADCIAYPFLKYAGSRDPADDELFHVVLDEHQMLGDEHPSLRAWIARMSKRPRAF